MSTHAMVNFCEYNEVIAKLYVHFDGYPSGLGKDLIQFFNDVKNNVKDTRFSDPSYLASKFIIWQAIQDMKIKQYQEPSYLNVSGPGIIVKDDTSVDFVYNIDCSKFDSNDGFPLVKVANYNGGEGEIFVTLEEAINQFKEVIE